MKAIQVLKTGDPDVLKYVDIPVPKPKENEVLVAISAAGVNFIDIYFRKGTYATTVPYVPGMEGSGIVEACGSKVKDFKKGERVAFNGVMGSYAEYASVPAERLVKLPDEISVKDASACMLQGMTAHYLANDIFPLKKGDSVLVHAAAGGVGLLLVQMLKLKGVTVFATVSTREKALLAEKAGVDHVILYTEQDFENEVRKIKVDGVKVVYDSVGKDTFEKSLASLRRRGCLVLFGSSSGHVPAFDAKVLNERGSLYLTRPSLKDYTATRSELIARSSKLFDLIISKKVKLNIFREFALRDAANAHQLLEGRKTAGKLLLIP